MVDAYGLKGWIKVLPHAAEPSAMLAARQWWLADATGTCRPVAVDESKLHSGTVVAKPSGVDERGGAEALKGSTVSIGRSEFPAAGDDAYYWVDLIGCEVTGADGGLLGTVSEVSETGAHAVLRVSGRGEHLIPFVAAWVRTVDMAARRIDTDWQEDWSGGDAV